jgi:hypothetical protein
MCSEVAAEASPSRSTPGRLEASAQPDLSLGASVARCDLADELVCKRVPGANGLEASAIVGQLGRGIK